MPAVNIIGKKALIARFEKMGAEAWALYQGKGFIVSGLGADELTDWLTDFETCESSALYTLRVYDSDTAPTSSQAGSDYLASINFKVVDHYEGMGMISHNNKLADRIKKLEEGINGKEEPEQENLIDIAMGWLKNPEQLGMVVGAIKQLWGSAPGLQPVGAAAPPPQGIAGFDPVPGQPAATDDDINRISKALDILGEKDPKIVVHLEKLAKLAKEEPLIFQGVLAKLDAL